MSRRRKYEMKKRAAAQAETRRRIVEAAVELHGTIGPARTSVSAIAELAGVQRHTYYRHFPDERSLFMACSGLDIERNPPPDHERWAAIDDPIERLAIALDQLYAYYTENEPMLSNVTRDAEVHPLTREITQLRAGPVMAAMHRVLSKGVPQPAQALIGLALQFTTWRSLTRDGGLSHNQAVDTMVGAVGSLAATGVPRTRRRRRSAAPRPASARSEAASG
jgi:AcrR family transcriptional regulator